MLLFLVACAVTNQQGPVLDGTQAEHILKRLTHRQWEATVVDLLHLPGPTLYLDSLLPDPATSTFENDASHLAITPTLWLQYQAAAEGIAERVTEPELLEVVLGDEGDTKAWVASFTRRAFRRPATLQECEALLSLYDEGAAIFDSGDPVVDGVRAVVAAVLQSPSFLYRSEGLAGQGPELGSHELAAKLSYALWNTMPDDALLDAADRGLTPRLLDRQVDRMLAHPKAHEMVADFHRQLLDIDNYKHIYRSETKMEYEDSLPWSMEQETYAFADRVVFSEGTVADLLTSSQTTIDDRVAEVYGIGGVPEGAVELVELDPDERAGVLTLSGFLAMKADKDQENLISRGGFVNDRLLCKQVPPPPSGLPPLPEEIEGSTLRERIEEHTTVCGGACHAPALNAIGFAFAGFDQTGRTQTHDQGQPVDATSTYLFEDGERSYDGVVELALNLSQAEEVHRCYSSHLLAWVEGRAANESDGDRLARHGRASVDGRPILDLLGDMVRDSAFRLDP